MMTLHHGLGPRPHFSLIAMAWTVLAGALLMLSCSDDAYTPDLTSPITIVKSDLLFEPLGRTGSVEVEARGTVTATLQSDWCTASVNGRVVSVTVTDNQSFEGRTALLTIQADGGSVRVPVQQRGMALASLDVEAVGVGNAGSRLSYYIRHDLPVTLQTDNDWLTATIEGDSLLVEVEPNTSPWVRRGVVVYECAGYEGQLEIAQYDLSTVLGEYYFGGVMGGTSTGFRFRLLKEDGQYYMNFFTMEDWKKNNIPVGFDEDRCIIYFRSNSTIYQSGQATYAFFFYNSQGQVAQTQDATMKALLYYNPFATSAGGSHYAALEDGGTWGDGTLSGFIIYMLSSFGNTPFIQFTRPYIVWLGE